MESIGRMRWGKQMIFPYFCRCPELVSPSPQPLVMQLPAGVVLGGDLSGPILTGPPHDPFKPFHAASSQLLQVCLIFTYNIFLSCSVVLWLQNWGFFFFFSFLVSLSLLFLCQYFLEEGMQFFWCHQCFM